MLDTILIILLFQLFLFDSLEYMGMPFPVKKLYNNSIICDLHDSDRSPLDHKNSLMEEGWTIENFIVTWLKGFTAHLLEIIPPKQKFLLYPCKYPDRISP